MFGHFKKSASILTDHNTQMVSNVQYRTGDQANQVVNKYFKC